MARCLKCNTVIESLYRHHYTGCPCGNLYVDGGTAYIRRSIRDGWDTMEDLSENMD